MTLDELKNNTYIYKVHANGQYGIQYYFNTLADAKKYVENILHKYYLNCYPFKNNAIQWISYHNKTRCYLIDGKSKFCVETIIQLKNT